MNIKRIGSPEVVDIIDKFINSNILNLPLATVSDIMECLHLVASGCAMPDQFLEVINKFVSENIPNKLGELDFITAGVESDFPNLIKSLIKDRGFVEFQDTLDIFNERMQSLKK
ncbi:hypothetical protein ESCOCK445M_22575 [Escherichia coli]